jgi:hypothetical protein
VALIKGSADSVAQPTGTPRQNLITVVSVMILIGTEIFGLALAGGWAIAGLFELGPTVGYILMGLFSLLGVYGLAALWRQATTVERIG